LTITNAVSGDEGNYICTASNVVGTGSSQQTFLDVTGSMYNQYNVVFYVVLGIVI